MKAGFIWTLVGSLAAWLTLLAPPLALLSWLTAQRALPIVLGSLLLAPFVFGLLMRALRSDRTRVKHRWTVAFGLGAVLLPISLLGIPIAWLVSPQAAGIVVLAAWIALAIHARRRADIIADVALAIEMPGILQPLRFLQLSDIHIGSRNGDFLARVVTQALAHAPEFVVITGDLVDESRIGPDDLTALGQFDCPVYFCIGNHERYVDLDAALRAIAHHGVTILRDSSVEHGPLRIIGIDDRDRPDELPGVLARIGQASHKIDVLLYHRPDGWSAARAAGIPLTLSGHTHGGQIWPFGLLVKRQYPELIGRFEREGTTLNVSSGTGTWGPSLRLGTRSEMTVIDLVPAP